MGCIRFHWPVTERMTTLAVVLASSVGVGTDAVINYLNVTLTTVDACCSLSPSPTDNVVRTHSSQCRRNIDKMDGDPEM